MNKRFFVMIGLFVTRGVVADPPPQAISFFSPRSQSTNAAREIVGWHPYIHRFDAKCNYTVWTLTPAYNHSTRPNRMAHVLFGTDQLTITGSQVTPRCQFNILADYFGLSPFFSSTVLIKPKIQNVSLTINGYVGFDAWLPGLYFRVHAPAVWTAWELELKELVDPDGINQPFPALYMADGTVNPGAFSFTQALQGATRFGQMQSPLQFGKVNGRRSNRAMSDIQLTLGYDLVNNELGFAGLAIRAAIPTGNRPNGEFLFEPFVGNGKHWELGLGFSGQTLMWEQGGTQFVYLLSDINFMHLFKNRQQRSFDLKCNQYLSRYMLVKEFDESGTYISQLSPLINFSTFPCDVTIDIQMDLVAMLSYMHNNLVADVGYNGWVRSKEKITILGCLPTNRLALKGIQNVAIAAGVPSQATQSDATIFGNEFADQAAVADPNPPVFLTSDALDPKSAASPYLITHKFFAHVSYGWPNACNGLITPFLGAGGEVEFEGINTRQRFVLHNDTMSQWGLWIKGGISY